MKTYDNLIIGFGKGGKTLAASLAKAGQRTALIEKSPLMYGGTCINVACLPTKSLENSARQSAIQGGPAAAFPPGDRGKTPPDRNAAKKEL